MCGDAKGRGALQAEGGVTRLIRGYGANLRDSTEGTVVEHRGSFHFVLYYSPPPFPLNHPFPTFPTLADSQECSEDRYLAGQDLSSDGAAHKGLHVLPCLLLLHRRGCVEGDFHHGESSGCAVRRGSNQRPGLQVGKREARACPSSTYFLPCLPSAAAASPGLGILMTRSQDGWEIVGGLREGPREEREGVQVLGWEGGCR